MKDNEMVFLDKNQVLEKTSIGKSQLYKLIKKAAFGSQRGELRGSKRRHGTTLRRQVGKTATATK